MDLPPLDILYEDNHLLAVVKPAGLATACGLVGGVELPLTVYPFILRGVRLAGIDSAWCPMSRRRAIWGKLAAEWKPDGLETLAREVDLRGLEESVEAILAGQAVGRTIVKIKDE